jgi:hypothetical protein
MWILCPLDTVDQWFLPMTNLARALQFRRDSSHGASGVRESRITVLCRLASSMAHVPLPAVYISSAARRGDSR